MRILPTALILLIPMLAGCEDTPKERLEGRWVGETVDSFPPAHRARALGWAKGLAISFQGSRVTVSIPAESPRQGTFKMAQLNPDEMQITFLRPHGAADDVRFRFEGDDGLRWLFDDGRSILLRKSNN